MDKVNLGGVERFGIIDKKVGKRFFYFIDFTNESNGDIIYLVTKWSTEVKKGELLEWIGENHPEILPHLTILRVNGLIFKSKKV